jgi:hypothetical protein
MEIIGLDKTKVTVAGITAEFVPGTVGRVDGTGNLYRYIKYNSGAGTIAAAVGKFAYFYAPSGASAGATSEVTSDLSDSAGIGAGVLQAIIPTGGYGWIQISGIATLTLALTAGADGNALTAVGSTDGALDVSAAVTDYICAVAVDASAKIVFLTCPL